LARGTCRTHESIAHTHFKKAFIRAGARDAVPSVQLDSRFPVIPVRALANQMTQRFLDTQRILIERVDRGEVTQKDAQLEIEHFWAGALRRAVIDGDVATGSVMAGQSVGMVTREQSTQEVIDEFIGQALAVIVRRDAAGGGRDVRRSADDVADTVG
jgi:enoyl-[acyl-carrier protein] reductase II